LSANLKNTLSTLCLLIVFSSYCGYYFESTLFLETFSEAKEKFELANSLLSPSVQGQEILRGFSSTKELISFLKSDDTNELVYSSPNFVCHHFSETLIRNARAKGYRIEYLGIYGESLLNYQNDYVSYLSSLGVMGTWGDGEGHAVCVVYIGEQMIIIEPQTDVVFRLENGRYHGIYMGEY